MEYDYSVQVDTTNDFRTTGGTVAPEETESDADGFGSIHVADLNMDDLNGPGSITMGVSASRIGAGELAAIQYRDLHLDRVETVTASYFRHTAFIADVRPKAFPCVWTGDRYFAGDNRGYSATSSAFRTRLQANSYWTGPSFTQSKWTNDTRLVTGSGALVEKRNAGTAGMSITKLSQSTYTARFRGVHGIGNPFCVAGQISYSWEAAINRAGAYAVFGSHRQAPHHEIYRRDNDTSTWDVIYRAPNLSFDCLIGSACQKRIIAQES